MNRILIIILSLCIVSTSFAALNNQKISPFQNEIKLYHTDDKGIPTFVSGNLRDKVVKGAELNAVYEYFDINKDIYKIQSPIDELQLLNIEIDKLGMTHLRLQQKYNGLDVIGSDITAHFRNDGMFTSVNGYIEPIKNINITPQIIASDALKKAQDDLRIDFGEGIPTEVKLKIFPWKKETYLAWHFFIVSDVPMGRWEYFIDAHTGEIIFKANRIMNAEAIGSGTGVMGNTYNHVDTWDNGVDFEMVDYTRRANNNIHGHNGQMASNAFIRTYLSTTSLPGTLATDADNVWSGTNYSPAVDGHMYSALFYDWVLREFGRNSYNNNGSSMNISVNYSLEGDNNAYWNGSQIVVWSWSTGWRSLAGCPDVISHEWGHAITGSTSGLIYQLESGALNESFSDMIGAAFEFAHDTLDTPDWLMGENGVIGGTGFRDMENPHSKGDPDFYGTTDPYWIDVVGCTPTDPNDWCGVHTNSGVGNKWFSLLSDGGVHSGITVNGLSVDTVMMIAFRANTVYWNANTNYEQAAAGTITAAHDLDPSGIWEFEVAQAWTAVGVATPMPSLAINYPTGTPTTTTPNVDEVFDVVVTGTLGGVPVPNSGLIYISLNGGAYQSSPMTEITAGNYQATLPGRPCGDVIDYYITVGLTAPAVTVSDGSPTNPFTAVPATGTITVFQDDFETDLGWTISGGANAWARGIPTGGGGEYGNPDPTSGTVGANVMGYNLTGDYANSIPEFHVTSSAIDCSTISTAILKFDRWLGVEQPAYDHAYIKVSTDNVNWTTVWQNDREIADDVWTATEVNISSVAAGQSTVYVRFTMGTSDSGWRFCGWNIDNLRITGSQCNTSSNLTITTTTLPDWTANLVYSQQLNAINGVGTLVWTDKNNDLATSGLALSSSGLLSGTVTTAQAISFTALVNDDVGSDEQILSFTINPPISITTLSLPNPVVGFLYSQQVSATGGTGALIFTDKNNDLTATGLSISSSGLLSGTVLTPQVISFTALVTDNIGATTEQLFSFTISQVITITPPVFPDWTAGVLFSQQIVASGGTGSLTYTDKNSDLISTGLSVSTSGLVSGTPVGGIHNFICLVTDSLGSSNEELMSININDSLLLVTTSLADWTIGVSYSNQMIRSGGTGIITFIDKNLELVGSGLTLSSTGLLNGIPTTAGVYAFTLQITDTVGATDEQLLTITLNDSVAITTTMLPDGNSDTEYTQQLTSSGGTGLITWTDKNNELTAYGLSISSNGLISGIPLSVGTITFTAVATDDLGSTNEQLYSFDIIMSYVCGDADGSGTIDIADLVFMVAYMFQGGSPPAILASMDIDGSGTIDIADLIGLVNYMFGIPQGADPVCGVAVF